MVECAYVVGGRDHADTLLLWDCLETKWRYNQVGRCF